MDYYGINRGSIRAEALKKLADLTVENVPSNLKEINTGIQKDDFSKLLTSTPKFFNNNRKNTDKLSNVAIAPKEYEVLIALCDSTKKQIKLQSQIKILIDKFKIYLFELPDQKFSYNIVSNSVAISPWTLLGEKLTVALINLCFQANKQYFDEVVEIFHQFIEKFFDNVEPDLSNFLTLIGVIDGLNRNAKFLTFSSRTFKIFTSLDACIDNFDFLSDVENYSDFLYDEPNEYKGLLDRDFCIDFSPILYLEKLSRLMTSIINSIIGNTDESLIQFLLNKVANNDHKKLEFSRANMEIIKILTDLALRKLEFLDRGETFIVYSTYNRLKLGYLSKSFDLQVLSCGMFTDNLDIKTSRNLFKSCVEIKEVMLDSDLGLTIFQFGALLVYKDETVGPLLTRVFTSVVANPKLPQHYCLEASKSVGLGSKKLPQDAVVTTIYSLTNLLFVSNEGLQLPSKSARRAVKNISGENGFARDYGSPISSRRTSISSISQVFSKGGNSHEFDENDYKKVCENAVTAIIEVSEACDDESVPALACTILSQKVAKIDSAIGPLILKGLSSCAPFLPEREFIILVRLLNKLSFDALEKKNMVLLGNLTEAKCILSTKLKQANPLYFVYLHELLQAIISKGDVQQLEHHRPHTEISEVGDQIAIYLKPLAALLPDVNLGQEPLDIKKTETINLFRNIWFNMVVHGYNVNSKNSQIFKTELERIAYNSPPLASELSWDRTETSIELNTVLRRGSSNHNIKDHRSFLGDIFEVHRTLSYPKLMFLSATVFCESLRVKSGNCSKILLYFTDPSIKSSGIEKYLGPIAFKVVRDYITLVISGANKQFTADHIAAQLTTMLTYCTYPVEDMQDAAMQCCDLLINKVPASLCHKKSLFALFDILTLLFQSIADADVHEYEPTTSFRARCTGIKIQMSDDYGWRCSTFNRFHEKSKHWINLLLYKSNVDVKSLIQSYVSSNEELNYDTPIQFGLSFALQMSGNISSHDRELNAITYANISALDSLPTIVAQLNWRSNFVTRIMNQLPLRTDEDIDLAFKAIRDKVYKIKLDIKSATDDDVLKLLSEIAGLTLLSDVNNAELVRYMVEIPFMMFEPTVMISAAGVWFAVMKDKPKLSMLLISELAKKWEESIELRKGLFSQEHDLNHAEFDKMEYAPSNRTIVNKLAEKAQRSFGPHLEIIKLFSSNFEATLNQSDHLLKLFTRFVEVGLENLKIASYHPLSRLVRFELIKFSFEVLHVHIRLGSRSSRKLTNLIFDGALTWFRQRSTYPFGGDKLKFKSEAIVMREVSKMASAVSSFKSGEIEMKKNLFLHFLDDEIYKFNVWLTSSNPNDSSGSVISTAINNSLITRAYELDPILAINLALRYKHKNHDDLLQQLIIKNPLPAVYYPDAVQFFIGINAGTHMPSYQLLFWAPLSPIDAITLFLPPFGANSFILQYTMRSLESHDVNLTFFYVPQIVQSLRFDAKGYVERFIIETAKVSQLFAHQIIWNMLANSFKDEDSTEPDDLKPVLDRIQETMLKTFSKEDLQFYHKEFGFFNEVTDISGKLKPYIKKTKAEKKAKIDEEMALIKVEPGVYLPSNPDGVLVDINRKSGRPLQSHAKAPFMATFKIKKDLIDYDEKGKEQTIEIEKWQSAIFKVGDDCRQDVLALQLISIFRTIWNDSGLDLYVFPYRVTATAPGCGVIDVLPNSTSRDMLGREAVNGLYEYFITKFGPENSIEFQKARNNLIKSLAAYSIISYLLQFKDRHNGNIMYDDQGHILHIDFGFCFDIVPGGVKFEAAPFKLTHEMIMVLGGNDETQSFKWFEELCIKGYLACRPYLETIVRTITPMLESGLPCFKDTTIKNLRSRFVPTKTDKEAALYFKKLIKKSMESFYTKGYDEFQRLTNGIPY
ncbi:STT4 [Candida jiufengensis]|uniref:STT4 n=1 Tax=Candida jiufengensis TaxID=497108 RepID=UPI00222540CB|nr:STT4 [Candida jiufengensis]KAI5954298.1 STT4 [Candida jiufengensis]